MIISPWYYINLGKTLGKDEAYREMTRISEYQTGELSSIPGTKKNGDDLFVTPPVVVDKASFQHMPARNGQNEYVRTIITLDNGSMYRSASAPIADTFGRVPEDEFPVGPLVFEQQKATNKSYQPYWIARDATDDELRALDAANKK